SIANPPYDDKAGQWTHDLLVSQLGTVTYNGHSYYQFYLDANQEADGPISLIAFQIFVTSGSPYTSSSDLTALVSSGTPAFDLNGAGAVRVDISSQNGSGSGDMYILVPTSDIGDSGNLYLYAGFGQDASGGGYASNDGFEEWYAYEGPSPAVPDGGGTALLLGAALVALALLRRKLGGLIKPKPVRLQNPPPEESDTAPFLKRF
ncbi:MAG: VPDSG-CTERM sorting domain-containing protein, partial [Verrucomicrobia bacterium]|nr:VPDSG-CTERM sorting domain-containing protein [Verrucomicrobiota bacterium]